MNEGRGDYFKTIFLCCLSLCSAIFLFRYVNTAGTDLMGDFRVFYETANRLAANSPVYVYSDDAYQPYLYPPYFLFLLYPLSLLGYYAAAALWFIPQLVFYIGAMRKACGTVPLLILPFVIVTLVAGQNGLLTSALFILGFALLDKKPVIAGIVLALISFKPQLIIFVPVILIARGSWKAMLGFFAMLALLVALSVMSYGFAIWGDFMQMLAHQAEVVKAFPEKMQTGMASVYIGMRMSGAGHIVSLLGHALVAVAAMVYLFRLFRQNKPEAELVFFIMLFLASPYVMVYDLALMAVPLYFVMKEKTQFAAGRITLLLGCFMPLVGTQLNGAGIPAMPVMLLAVAVMMAYLYKNEIVGEVAK